MKPLKLVHIVRRYGAVGGMERYVWELTHELAAMGYQVTVLCETLEGDNTGSNINIVTLGSVQKKPRWMAHLRFSRKVSQWVAANPDSSRIIHSHERTSVHHVTTFHGPPFASVRNKPLWKRISLRIYANLWLEKRELYGSQVKAVIPNSPLIAASLLQYYPDLTATLLEPVVPGVRGDIPVRPLRDVGENGGVIGFVGKEWKRKGLHIAVAIVAELRRRRPDIEFVVVGPEPASVRFLFNGWNGGYTLLGETDATPLYAGFDLLLHPARQEPYGMVIAEARAAAVPVLVSNQCGISSELDPVQVMNLSADSIEWSYACEQMLNQQAERYIHSWRDVAAEQVSRYREIETIN